MSPNREKQNMNSPLSFPMMWAETEVDVTATVYLHQMVKQKCPHLALYPPHISLSQINTPVFLTPRLKPNSPVSSLLHLFPNVLKTGYLHLNTNLKVWHPPPTHSDIPVSQSIKMVDPAPDLLLHTFLKNLLTTPAHPATPTTPKSSPPPRVMD